jgi:hypothetical protein
MAQPPLSDLDPEKHADQKLIPSLVSDATTANATTSPQAPLSPFENLRIFQELVGIRSSEEILEPPEERAKGKGKANQDNTNINSSNTNDKYAGFVMRPNPLQGRDNWKFKSLFTTSSPANDGYYVSAIQREWKAFMGYQLSNAWITSVYLLQIFVAATITALAAYEGHRVTLTVLGAVNTVLAGLVAYFKGMGLPNRLRKSRDQYQHVKEYIDYKERQFVWFAKFRAKPVPEDSSLAALDPWVEAEQVRKLYEAAQKDEQANYPDVYINDNERRELEAININNRDGRTMSPKNRKTPAVPPPENP